MTEYALPAVLAGLVILAGVMWFVNGGFQGQGALKSFQAEGYASGTKGFLKTRQLGKNPSLQVYQYYLPNGRLVSVSDFPVSASALVDVAGAHGTSEEMLGAMDRLIAQMLLAGEITQDQANLMQRLSQSGHQLAEDERLMEEAALSCGADKSCLLAKIDQDPALASAFGRTKYYAQETVLGKAQAIGLNSETVSLTEADWAVLDELMPGVRGDAQQSAATNYGADNLMLGADMVSFIRQYGEVKAQILETSPESQAMVAYLSANILKLGEASAASFSDVRSVLALDEAVKHTNVAESRLKDVVPEDFNERVSQAVQVTDPFYNSRLTDAHSASICQMGHRRDTGAACQ